jgi:hypothetical protein
MIGNLHMGDHVYVKNQIQHVFERVAQGHRFLWRQIKI